MANAFDKFDVADNTNPFDKFDQETVNPSPTIGQQAEAAAKDIPRQLGLAARYSLQGLASTAGIVTDPLAYLVNKAISAVNPPTTSDLITGKKPYQLGTLRGATEGLLNSAGLPQPQTADERTVGQASELLAGTGGMLGGAAGLAKQIPRLAPAMSALTSRPGLQASSAIGSGLAGGEAKELGGGPLTQFGASLVGGLGLPVTVSGLDNLANKGVNAVKNFFSPQTVNIQIDNAIKQAGVNLEGLPNNVQQSIRDDVQNALKIDNSLSPDALRRLVDYRAVGATPMRSSLTLNPADITRDRNLAKLAANSTDSAAQVLPNLQNQNNATLIRNLNDLGANTQDDAIGAGNKIISALQARDTAAKSAISNLYSNARDTSGRSALLDASAFTNKANDLLDNALLGGKLPSDVRNLLNKTATGEMPLTVDTAEQFKTRIGDLQRASNDRAEKMALGLVRQSLDEAPLIAQSHGLNPGNLPMSAGSVPPSQMTLGQESIDAFNQARRANAGYMKMVEKTPALQAVRDGVEPDKFVQQYIVGNGTNSNVMDVAMLKRNIRGNQDAMDAVRGQILAHLKNKGVNGAADEVANFSPTNYNKALNQIGDRKLNLFFDKNEVEQLNRIGRVASYEKFQPTGSAVNNSNTAAAAFTAVIDKLANSSLIKSIPFGSAAISQPATNISISLGTRNSLNAPKALRLPIQNQPITKNLIFPGLTALQGGLLNFPPTEQPRHND